jgi:hypothetical protein
MRVYDGSQWIAASAASQAILTKYKYVATAGQTTFSGTDANSLTLAYTVGSIIVTLNGVVLNGADYTATSGTSIVLGVAASLNDELNILSFSTFDVANTYTQSQVDAAFLTKSNPNYTGTLTGGTGVVNLGSGQFYKDASGNVGIGTVSFDGNWAPKFQVVSGANDGTGGIMVESYRPSLIFKDNSASAVRQHIVADSSSLIFGSGDASFTERMRIDSSGNLLVGQTTNGASGKVAITTANGASGSAIATTNVSGTAQYYAAAFYNNGATNSFCGGISVSGTTTTFATSSDYRLKENIAPMTGALDVVAQLKPCTYSWKSTGESTQGFIAHELQEVVPECVVGEKDAVDENDNPRYQGIDTSFLVATLTAAIQELAAASVEQQAMITSQSELINAQQAALTTLTERVAALEGAQQ